MQLLHCPLGGCLSSQGISTALKCPDGATLSHTKWSHSCSYKNTLFRGLYTHTRPSRVRGPFFMFLLPRKYYPSTKKLKDCPSPSCFKYFPHLLPLFLTFPWVDLTTPFLPPTKPFIDVCYGTFNSGVIAHEHLTYLYSTT